MKNKLPDWIKSSLLILLLLSCFFIMLFLLKHAYYYSILDKKMGFKYYPNYYSFLYSNFDDLINVIGTYAIQFFYLTLIVFIIIFSLIIKKYLPNKKDLKFHISITVVLLFFAEIALRFLGYSPGIHSQFKFFQPVDKIWLYKSYSADEDGILVVNSKVARIVSERIKKGNSNYGGREYGEIFGLSKEFIEFKKGIVKNEFYRFFQKIQRKKVKSDLDSAILNYIESPINADGFFSIEFKKSKVKKPVVLLLGDSFTWGHSAMPKTNSFAHLLMSKGYVVYNTGISATDVAQYLTVSKKYISKLKPDFVIVNFYMGNDVNYFKREVKPFNPVFYCTNAGNIYSSYGPKSFGNEKEAYNFVLNQLKIPQDICFFNRLMSKTTITSMTWGIMKKTNLFPYLQSKYVLTSDVMASVKKPYCNVELKEIERLCGVNNSKFILSCIPDVMSFKIKRAKDVPNLFEGLKYYEMKISKSDYNLDDGHFNEQGHRKYAAFLHRIMKSKTK